MRNSKWTLRNSSFPAAATQLSFCKNCVTKPLFRLLSAFVNNAEFL